MGLCDLRSPSDKAHAGSSTTEPYCCLPQAIEDEGGDPDEIPMASELTNKRLSKRMSKGTGCKYSFFILVLFFFFVGNGKTISLVSRDNYVTPRCTSVCMSWNPFHARAMYLC